MTTTNRSVRIERGDFVLELTGDIDYQVGRELCEELDELLDAARGLRFVVDLSGVPFLDSSGLRALLRANAACDQFVLRGVRPQLERVISLIAPGLLTIEFA